MGAGGSTAKKKKANSPGKADEQRPKKAEKGGESVVSGGDEAEKVAAEGTAADKGDKVEELDVFVPCKMLLLFYLCWPLFGGNGHARKYNGSLVHTLGRDVPRCVLLLYFVVCMYGDNNF